MMPSLDTQLDCDPKYVSQSKCVGRQPLSIFFLQVKKAFFKKTTTKMDCPSECSYHCCPSQLYSMGFKKQTKESGINK